MNKKYIRLYAGVVPVDNIFVISKTNLPVHRTFSKPSFNYGLKIIYPDLTVSFDYGNNLSRRDDDFDIVAERLSEEK